jgi:hypothetical protein
MKSKILLFISILIPVCGCNQKHNSTLNINDSDFVLPSQMITNRVASLEQKVDDLQRRIGALEWDNMVGEWSRTNKFVSLNFDDKGYQPVQTTIGQLLISSESATPYLDGYKIDFQIGNPQSVTYDGVTVTLKWGPPATRSTYTNQTTMTAWQNAQKTKIEKLPFQVLAGYWNNAEVIVTPATTEELRNLQISIETSSVSLRNANNTP